MDSQMMHAISSCELGIIRTSRPLYCVTDKLHKFSEKQTVNIDILNDHCLKHIFTLLPIVDKIRIERVCKRWSILSKESWNTTKRLYLLTHGYRYKLNKVKIGPLLSRCGKHITHLNLASHNIDDRIFTQIIQICPNLRNIRIDGYKDSYLYVLATSCKNITHFAIEDKYHHLAVDLNLIFETYKNLESFSITGYNGLFDIIYFCWLSETLHTLILRKCCIVNINFTIILRTFKNLKHLAIEKCYGFHISTIKAINKCGTNLRVLKIYSCIGALQMLSFTRLTNLQILKIKRNQYLTDFHITDMVLHCRQLTNINIHGCREVTDEGLEAIATLPKLEKLNINFTNRITDYGLRNIHNLKKFKCEQSPLITDVGIWIIVKSSPKLQLLNFWLCSKITRDIRKAIKQIRPRIILTHYCMECCEPVGRVHYHSW